MNKTFKIAKIALIAMLVIAIIGAVLFGICKLNYGADIKGCVEVTIALDEDSKTESVAEKYQDDITKIFKDNGYKFAKTTRKATDSSGFVKLVYSVKTKNADKTIQKLNGSFKTDLNEYLSGKYADFSYEDSVTVSEIGSSYDCKLLTGVLLGTLILTLAITIYSFIRFKWASGFTTLLSVIMDLLLFVSISAITRIRVDALCVNVIWVATIYSLLTSLVTFFVLKKNSKVKIIDADAIKEKALTSAQESSKYIFIVTVALIVMLALAIIFVPLNVKLLFIYSIIALLIAGADAILVKPVLRYWLSKIKKNKKKA